MDAGDLSTIAINQTTTIKARIWRSDSDWSALHEVIFFVDEDRSALKVTEIMYNPSPETMATGRGVLGIVGDAGTPEPRRLRPGPGGIRGHASGRTHRG